MSESRSHISLSEWEDYLRGELPAADLLAIDDHVSACRVCRERAADLAGDVRGTRELRHALEEESVHLNYEQIEQFVDGSGSREERAWVTGHTADCSSCRDEVADLTAYARSRRSWLPTFWPAAWWVAAAAALVIAGGAGLTWMLRHGVTPEPHANLARSVTPAPAVRSAEQPQATPSAPSRLGRIAGKREVQLGTPSEDQSGFRLLSPVGTRVPDTRPVLRWLRAPGAEYYRVQVFDADFRLVASSPELSQTEWRVPQPLKPGKIYSWQVTAKQAGQSVTAPEPPAPQALFEIDQSASPSATKPAQ